MKIRPARPTDADAIAALYGQLEQHHARSASGIAPYEMPDVDWIEHARKGLADTIFRFYVAERGPDLIAFMKLFFEKKTWGLVCEVENLVVDERVRDQGVGGSMMERAEELARQEGALGIRVNVLHANHEGRRFYVQQGYRAVAVRYGKSL